MLSGCLQVKASLALYFSISCPLCKGIHVVVMLPQSAPREVDDADSATITPSYLNSFNSDPQHIVQLCVAPCQFKQSPQHHGVQRSDDKLEEKKEDRKRERQEEEYIQFIMVQAFPDFKLFT
ncbi:hypothetical protein Y032_0363g3542 [Ancylostoma ceylanicum]|uniref:Uncharacterized protein n=1 Tax=Ancylostoma ceylanicum TaxID=53326 RepID=A0A016RVZ7_9BILA|nr:hypothetical protein Y032_0363g3542 [Ancylostoma ceylanicum]